MKNRCKLILNILCLCIAPSMSAQYTFSISLDLSGCSQKGIENALWRSYAESYFNDAVKLANIGFPTLSECNNARSYVSNESNEIGSTSCRIRFIVGPCSGPPQMSFGSGPDGIGGVNGSNGSNSAVLQLGAVDRSFYSANPVSEVNDWEQGTELRDLVLNHKQLAVEPTHQPSGDAELDQVRNDYEFTGRMPEGSNFFSMRNRQGVQSIDEWSASDDLKPISIDLIRPVDMTEDLTPVQPVFGESWETEMQENDTWDSSGLGKRISDTWNVFSEWGKEQVTGQAKSLVKSLLPTRIANAIKRGKEITDAVGETRNNVFEILRKAPDDIAAGRTQSSDALYNASTPILELGAKQGGMDGTFRDVEKGRKWLKNWLGHE